MQCFGHTDPYRSTIDTRAEQVAVELILAIDCSSSVQSEEYALQIQGVADALRSPEVIQAITSAMPNGVAVTLVQWSGKSMQIQVLPWTHARNKENAAAFAKQIEGSPRYMQWSVTAIGEALRFSAGLFKDNNFEGTHRVIGVSGDGSSNQGEYMAVVRPLMVAAGLTINGLAILNDEPDLDKYYK